MTVPPPDPPQWGTGLPGIPSMWDTAPAEPQPSGWDAPAPVSRRARSGSTARRWVWAGLGAAVLVAVGSAGGGGGQVAVAPEVAVAVPAVPGPQVVPPPGPAGVVPPPEPDGGLVARRAEGDAAPFGLPAGASVVLTDAAAGSQLSVSVVPVTREPGRLIVDVELRTPATTAFAVVPALLLRLPDGSELGHSGSVDGQDVPPVLGQGLLWRGTLVYDAVPASAVLVLHDGRSLAAWTVTAG